MSVDPLLTLGEAARELRCSVATVKRRIRAGALPAFRDGRIVRVRAADLRRYILEHVERTAARGAMANAGTRPLQPGERLWD